MPVKGKITSNKTSRLASARSKNIFRAQSRTSSLSVPVYSLTGRVSGTLALPKEIFGQKVNKKLLAQAVRVYMTNQKYLLGSTKTRGQVRGSTAKIYRQKGTGRARHGAIRAPIFVGGGITFGPKSRNVRLELSKKMKKAALIAALSDKMGEKNIVGVSGIEKATGKTKEMAKLVGQVSSINPSTSLGTGSKERDKKKKKIVSALIVTQEKMDNVVRGVSNIQQVDVLPASLLNAYEVLKHEILIITKDAADLLRVKGKAERVKE